MTYAPRALALIDDSALDAPELRCRAILVIGDCRSWNPVGDLAAARALVSEAGRLAVEHGWPDLAARAAITYQAHDARRHRPHRGGARAGRARHGRRRRLAASAGRDRCPAGVSRTAIAPTMNGPSPRSRPRPPRSSGAIRSVECWWPRIGSGCTSARLTPTIAALARDVRVARDAVGGIWMLQAFMAGAQLVPATRRPRRLRRRLRGVHTPSRLAPAWDRPMCQ